MPCRRIAAPVPLVCRESRKKTQNLSVWEKSVEVALGISRFAVNLDNNGISVVIFAGDKRDARVKDGLGTVEDVKEFLSKITNEYNKLKEATSTYLTKGLATHHGVY